ncbi:hypothetical protein [Sphingomonas oligophenolica]|uniref:PepSY domain-containing protein n=1 Tax=Sphingomonas oligophenolica TaxID=301154 RepID=A0A502CMX7_9SPHN|nr:hypothetical protein [Sphingomonas oligophenolica]TPG14557.1 hypothetical protein EAH84_04515 [Sphingomonas oligophenolica]
MRAKTMQQLRRYHLYIGMLLAPAIIFFAFSGAIQTIGWQDDPAPPGWITAIANIHKKQTLSRPRKPRPAAPAAAASPDRPREAPVAKGPSPIPLKAFVLLLSAGLIASAALGIAIALANRTTRRMSMIMLAIGIVLPPLLLLV